MVDPKKKLERLEKDLAELRRQIDLLEKERRILLREIAEKEEDDGSLEIGGRKGDKVFKKIPMYLRKRLFELGVSNDEALRNLLLGSFNMDDVKNKQIIYYYSYKVAKTPKDRLLAIRGMGPKFSKEILDIVNEEDLL